MKIRSFKTISASCCTPQQQDSRNDDNKRSADNCCPSGAETAPPVTAPCNPPPTAPVSNEKPPCCGPPTTTRGGKIDENVPGFLGWMPTDIGQVARISTTLTWQDRLGGCKARWGIKRMAYIVPPGLYAIGTPGEEEPVVVTANYKMSYDLVRQALAGRNCWLLVLETFGVNVWCAAGKGSFGTDELVERIASSGLSRVVKHRRLILPILGAPGVAAHEVYQRSGFNVSYAAIRAEDLPHFLDNSMITIPEMRELTFSFYERLVLVPVELVHAIKPTTIAGLVIFLTALLLTGPGNALLLLGAFSGAVLSGIVGGALLLPWVPGTSFAVKGAILGLAWSIIFSLQAGWHGLTAIALTFALAAVSGFYTLNFTGCSTYTSRTGVKKEMRLGLPLMAGALATSLVLLLVNWFI